MNKHTLASTFAFNGKVERSSRTIFGVSVATEGEARGHGIFLDATTLQQLMQAAQTYANGLKVKGDHGSGVFDTIGFLRNFRIEGVQLRADLEVLQSAMGTPEHPGEGARLFDMAEKIPDTFGISVYFAGPDEELNGSLFARCSEIYSADVVSEPAANPTGLFARGNGDSTGVRAACAKLSHAVTVCSLAALQDSIDKLKHPSP